MGLSEVRRAVLSRGDSDAVREEVDRLRESRDEASGTIEALARRLAELEARVAALENGPRRRRRWLP